MGEPRLRQTVAWADGLAIWEWHHRHCPATYRRARSRGHTGPDGHTGRIRWNSSPGDRPAYRSFGGPGTPSTAFDRLGPWPRLHPGNRPAGGSTWGDAHRATLCRGGDSRDAYRLIQCGPLGV